MRALLLILLLAALSHANTFGLSRLSIERYWTVNSTDGFDFTGALVVNESNQRVISVTVSPGADFYTDSAGTVWVHHSGEGSSVIYGKAIVDVDYRTSIESDSPLPKKGLEGTNMTEPNALIEREARRLSREDSSLFTIRNLVNWVHGSVAYDISYWGKIKSAREVFEERKGVCVEYAHLLLSMARSLGFDTRYVSGYVYADTWQPHAWTEIDVPGYGWLPADATFGQVGVLDNTHLAIHKGEDQYTTYDILLTRDDGLEVGVEDVISQGFAGRDPKGVSLSLSVDNTTYVTDVMLENEGDNFVYGTYNLLVPEGFGVSESYIVLLRPNETLHLYQGLNHSLFAEGYVYRIPVQASFNDAREEKTLSVNDQQQEGETGFPCLPALLLLLLLKAS